MGKAFESIKQGLGSLVTLDDPVQSVRLQLQRLGPGLVKRSVGQAIDTGREAATQRLWPVGEEPGLLAVGKYEVERVESLQVDPVDLVEGFSSLEKASHERPSRGPPWQRRAISPEICNDRKAALPGYPKPCPARLKVAACDQPGPPFPFFQRCGWTGMELVTISSDDQRPSGVGMPGKCEDTHPSDFPFPPSNVGISNKFLPTRFHIKASIREPRDGGPGPSCK